MKSLDSIPTTKISRASKLIATGARIGVNYLNYYKNKIVSTDKDARRILHQENASDIYDSLSNLKGSALKVAQMLSMDKSLLPQEYVEKFSLSQFSVPPLSAPLVNRTFQKYFGKLPSELFDRFDETSVHAASIGQVHRAEKDGKSLAVKIQYPGVADSISSDLKLVKPIAIRMFHLQGKDSDQYFKEVEEKLLEETDYELELRQSEEIARACSHIPHLLFPGYYPQWSSARVLTMDFMEGLHLSEFAESNQDQQVANKVGQALWDFYMYQIHALRKVQADPHPGNFLVSDAHELIAIDFGCVKHIPEAFYTPYFQLSDERILNSPDLFREKMEALELIKAGDAPEEIHFLTSLFHEMISVFMTPLKSDVFDFSNPEYFDRVYALAEQFSTDSRMKRFDSTRGSKHFIYTNRTFFGLYSLLHQLGAKKIRIPVVSLPS